MSDEADKALEAFRARVAAAPAPGPTTTELLKARDDIFIEEVKSFLQRTAQAAGAVWTVSFSSVQYLPKFEASEISVIVHKGQFAQAVTTFKIHQNWLEVVCDGKLWDHIYRDRERLYAGLTNFFSQAMTNR